MIAITGATGFLGASLLEALKHREIPAVALVRATSPRLGRLERICRWFANVDYSDPATIQCALEDCDTLVHALGLINGDDETLKRVNVDYTRNVVEAAKRANVKKIIFISSVAAIRQHGLYGKTKAEAETIIKSSGIPCLILRPAFVYGRRDTNNTGLMVKTLRRMPVIPLLGGGNFRLQPVYVDDVTSLLLESCEKPDLTGEYTVAGPEQISLKEMLEILAAHLKVRRLFIPIPLKPVQAFLRQYVRVFKKTRLPVKQILELDKHEAFDISKTVRDFQFAPVTFSAGSGKMFRELSCAG